MGTVLQAATVSAVEPGSIAQEIGLCAGGKKFSVCGEKMLDLIDYNFLCKSEFLTLETSRGDFEIEKDFDEDIGIAFESAVFDRVRPCANKCVFCFVDQQPPGLRDTLYVKDDDYRLSYLQGTYITLTNLTRADRERIARMYLGPFYVSVHATNPELRAQMLGNPKAARIMEDLEWFAARDIPFHAQIVLCPGLNDGAELERTLKDLSTFGENLLSVAIVPVGLTKFATSNLRRADKAVAAETLKIAAKFKRTCCSDEFFLLAGQPIPPAKYYGSFAQLSDGVGSVRLLLDEFALLELPKKISRPLHAAFAVSYAARAALEQVAGGLNKIQNLTVTVVPVKSSYWGDDITVAGLITSDDLASALNTTDADLVVLPSVMFKSCSREFLDGKTLDDIGAREFLVVDSVKDFVDYVNKY